MLVIFIPTTAFDAKQSSKGKIINVVYDDSRSMYLNNETRWCQAKYAMEVFCAMMGKDDTMNIFAMNRSEVLTIKGNDPNRVEKVHAMTSMYSGTPFSTVTKAGNALRNEAPSFERWLVILTDGSFDNTTQSTVQATLDGYNGSGIKTVYLAIGNDAVELNGDPSAGAYAEKASSTSEILSKVTSIANQIFEHQVLSPSFVANSGGETLLNIDIPTDQIVVFAQGEGATVGSLSLNGRTITPTSLHSVKHSGDVMPLNNEDIKVDTSLHGIVVTYDAGDTPFESGQFSISVSNATTVEYYYRPGVTVNCELRLNGKEVQASDKLYAGDYEVALNFINPFTGKVIESELLSAVKFTLTVTNNDNTQVVSDKTGSITLVEGNVDINAIAELPGNVFLESDRSYVVLPKSIGNRLDVSVSQPARPYDLNDMSHPEPMIVEVKYEDPQTGRLLPLTEEMWNDFSLRASSESHVSWQVEKGDAVGTWKLTPGFYMGDPLLTDSGRVSVKVDVEGKSDIFSFSGSGSQQADFEKLSRMNLIKMLAPRILAAIFIIWLLIGYIKKKRLHTRGLDPRCRFKGTTSPKQKISKDFFSVVMPYVPEKATVRCHKSAFQCNFPDLRIQATGRRSFKVINKSIPLKTTKICGEFYSDMDTLKKRNFPLGGFDITSVDPKTKKSLGTFSFK